MRAIPLAIGIVLVLAGYFISSMSPYGYVPIFAYLFGGILILAGLLLPSRRQMWQNVRERRMARRGNVGSDAAAILKRRYANGSITKKQYDSMMKDINNP